MTLKKMVNIPKLAEAIHRGDDETGVRLLSEWDRLTMPALAQDDKHPAWPCRLPGEGAKPGSNAQTGRSERRLGYHIMQTMQAETFKTYDLVLAAWLLSKGADLVGVDDADPQRVRFILTPRPSHDDLSAFEEGQTTAQVQSFYKALRRCKTAIYGGGVR